MKTGLLRNIIGLTFLKKGSPYPSKDFLAPDTPHKMGGVIGRLKVLEESLRETSFKKVLSIIPLNKPVSVGGQAVIEGVMMKAPKGWAVAVREPGGGIIVKKEPLPEPGRLLKLPLIRGIAALYYAMKLGVSALNFSAEKASAQDEKPLTGLALASTIGFAFLLGMALFLLLPLYITKLIGMIVPSVESSSLVFNLVDGVVRVVVFLLYIVIIGLWKDMRRVFEYHGAEHKTIHAYEAGKAMTVEEIRPFSPLHPRCGTSFLLIVMVTSIFVFSFIPQGWPFLYKFLSRLVLIPAVAGLSFELLKLSARPGLKNNPIVGLMILPGLMLQRLTTREPDDSQIEVAISALAEALSTEGATGPISPEDNAR